MTLCFNYEGNTKENSWMFLLDFIKIPKSQTSSWVSIFWLWPFLILLSFYKRKTISMWWLPLNLFVFKEIPTKQRQKKKKRSNQTHIAQSHWKCLSLHLSLFSLSSESSSLFALEVSLSCTVRPLPSPQFCEWFLHQGPRLLCIVQLVAPSPPGVYLTDVCWVPVVRQALCWARGIHDVSKTDVGLPRGALKKGLLQFSGCLFQDQRFVQWFWEPFEPGMIALREDRWGAGCLPTPKSPVGAVRP